MTQKQAQIIFIILNISAFFFIWAYVSEIISILTALAEKKPRIPFEYGVFYFFIATIFWLLAIIQYYGKRDKNSFWYKYAGKLLVYWFVFCLLLANAVPIYIKNKISNAGYAECQNPNHSPRALNYGSLVFILGKC
ncbi:MAG: hypothetical protein OEZ33_09000 [Gammaproteobacteria bacterium]|nr:hypothetical protein [Gammaproteobacteria bacterium]MDH5778335.1 hypothetical protein [Gammaproteobacteria bacterium]